MARPNPDEYRLTAEEHMVVSELVKNDLLMAGLRKILRYTGDVETEQMRQCALTENPNVHRIGHYASRADAIAKWEVAVRNGLERLAPLVRS